MSNSVELAIEDPRYASDLEQVRILPASERSPEKTIQRICDILSINGTRTITEGDKSRLQLAMDEVDKLQDLVFGHMEDAERFRYGWWPKDKDFVPSDEGALIRDFIIEEYREELHGYDIAMVFQQKINPVNRRGRLGTAQRLPGKMHHLTGGTHACITLDFRHWCSLTDRDRQRLVHHELEHLEVDKGLKLRTHDFEEFVSIVDLYGLRSESQSFSTDGHVADSLGRAGAQLELLQS
jgi:hypothetical protein